MFRNYLKTACKVFMRRKFFTGVSLFGISFTLVVLMAVAAVFDETFGPRPPEVHPDRLRGVFRMSHREVRGPDHTSAVQGHMSLPFLERLLGDLPGVEAMTIFSVPRHGVTFQGGGRHELALKYVDAAFWRVLDFHFLEGGPFTAADDTARAMLAVVNASTRRRIFGDGPAVGRTLRIEARRFRVVGVVPDVPMFRFATYADVWVPLRTWPAPAELTHWQLVGPFQALLLARDQVDLPGIQQTFRERLAEVEFPNPEAQNTLQVSVETPFETLARDLLDDPYQPETRPGLLVAAIGGVMLLFMILPSLNLINLNLNRVMERASEIGVRKAFGASSWVVVVQLVGENVLLTLVGGVIGFAGSVWVLHVLGDSGMVPYAELHLNLRLFLYALGLALTFGVLSGAYPAWRMSRLHPVQALRGGER